jgi:hypothetical protein
MHTEFGLKSLKGRDFSEDVGVDERIILKWILGMSGGRVWIGFIWLMVRPSGGLL